MKTILAIYLVLTAATTIVLADHVIDESETPQFLFVLSAESGSYDGETLKLTGVPSVVYFSDRPYRIAGHISLGEFVKLWGEGADDFTADPPNATLSIYNESGDIDVVIEITGTPDISSESVVFPVKVLLGDLPDMISASSLFIDMLTSNIKTPGVY
ncbi:MAG: hypothetical protein GY771_03260 [bacterium]|nr:hypothetical protein [bacterium]